MLLHGNTFWFRVAFIANCAGIVMAVVAVLPGLIDWLYIPELSDAKSTGFKHMVANVFSLGFFAANAAVNYTKLSCITSTDTSIGFAYYHLVF